MCWKSSIAAYLQFYVQSFVYPDLFIVFRTLWSPGLTFFKPMEFSIKLHTKKSRWSIEGSQVIISKKPIFVSLKIDFVLTSNANPDEITHEVIKLFPCSA